MTQKSSTREVVRVAIGAVVEKVSTHHLDTPATDTTRYSITQDPEPVRILITLRTNERVLGSMWELPGGKVEQDESAAQAVVRELREEVGIEIEPFSELPSVEHEYPHASVRLLPFVCRRISGQPRAIEVAEVRWVTPEELRNFRFPEASLPVIDALIKRMTTGCDTKA